jgi:hypothetical protein
MRAQGFVVIPFDELKMEAPNGSAVIHDAFDNDLSRAVVVVSGEPDHYSLDGHVWSRLLGSQVDSRIRHDSLLAGGYLHDNRVSGPGRQWGLREAQAVRTSLGAAKAAQCFQFCCVGDFVAWHSEAADGLIASVDSVSEELSVLGHRDHPVGNTPPEWLWRQVEHCPLLMETVLCRTSRKLGALVPRGGGFIERLNERQRQRQDETAWARGEPHLAHVKTRRATDASREGLVPACPGQNQSR